MCITNILVNTLHLNDIMNFKLVVLFYIFFCCILSPLKAQNKLVDSLLQKINTTNDTTRAQTYKELCWQFRNIDRKKALLYGEQSLIFAKRIGNKKIYADVTRFIGVIHWQFLYYEDAIEQAHKALQLSQEINDTIGIGFCYDNMGVVFYDQEQYNKAEDYILKALKEFIILNHHEGLGYVYAHLSRVYLKQKKVNKSLQAIYKSLEYRKKIPNNNYTISNTLRDMAIIYKENGEYVMAINYLKQAITMAGVADNKVVIANYSNQLGDIFFKYEQLDSAKYYSKQSFVISKEINHGRCVMQSSETLYKIFEIEQNYIQAFHYQKLYYVYKDSVTKEDTRAKIDFFDAKFRYKQREQELIATQKQQKIEAEKQKVLMVSYTILAVLLVFILISFFLFRMQQQQKKNNLVLAQKTLEIEQQSKKLSEVNQLKDKLFSIIAHDLRSPFQSLIGLLDLADLGALTEEDFKSFLPELSKNVSYTSGLLDNLLYWAKSQMEEASIKPIMFDIQEIANDKIELFEKQAISKNIVLENKINYKVSVCADKNMIDLVLRNLVANAVKFCNIHGRITISATQKSEFLIIAVTDTGNGINAENIGKLFSNQTFTTRGTNNEKGTGLGLMLCKEFVEKNGGKIWVETTLNEGSTFYFSVPMT